ncbi:MAG: glycosyltransferase family 4 protein [Bacteroidota bacterium]|nr:glycosyltransferase family 4 protein [Bacteroidota bacterium]
MIGGPKKVLFLYTEIAPYVLACLEKLANDHPVNVHLVRWPVNKEAPFSFNAGNIAISERDRSRNDKLIQFIDDLRPDIIFTSGWVDKTYLKIARKHRKRGIPVVLCSDTAWRGDLRQFIGILLGKFWIQHTFTNAWVTGEAQSTYARKLGFSADRIQTGFYSADTEKFTAIGQNLLDRRSGSWPHRFLCVARYISTKGHQYLCDAFAELCDEGAAKDWELWIAGTGELHQEVKDSPSGRHARIHHLGFKQAGEMEKVLEQCGVFVLPSLYEPWGVVVHEHACAGFPLLLSSAVGSSERFLIEMENGNRFVAGDKSILKTMMRMMVLSTDSDLYAMGERSAELGRSWSPRQWADTAIGFLEQRT